MAGRATGYSDYYKNNSNSSEDDEENKADEIKRSPLNPNIRVSKEDARKLALKKRLAKFRKAGK